MGPVQPGGMGHSKGWAHCCHSNIMHAWFFLQTPDFPVHINVGLGIHFHEAKLYCVSMYLISQEINTWV